MSLDEKLAQLDALETTDNPISQDVLSFARDLLVELTTREVPFPVLEPDPSGTIICFWDINDNRDYALLGIDDNLSGFITFMHDTTPADYVEREEPVYGGYSRTTADFDSVISAANAINGWYIEHQV